MKKMKLYRYVGKNGHVTTQVLLDDVKHYVYYKLDANDNKILTNGEIQLYSITVPEEELSLWTEIDDNGQQ